MPQATLRAATAVVSFFVGLTTVWLSGLSAPAEAWVAEWLVPTSHISVPAGMGDEGDAAKVYETVLREVFGGDDLARLIVVRSETVPYPFTEGHARYFNEVSVETVDDYCARRRLTKHVPPLDGLGARVALLDWDEPPSAFRDRKAVRWEAYRRSFPNAPAYVRFSPVGFNRAVDEAFLYTAEHCGESCGEGWLVLLRKSAGRWEIARWQPVGFY